MERGDRAVSQARSYSTGPVPIIEPDIPSELWAQCSTAFEAAQTYAARALAAAPIIEALANVGNGPTSAARYMAKSGRLASHGAWSRRRCQHALAAVENDLPPKWGAKRG